MTDGSSGSRPAANQASRPEAGRLDAARLEQARADGRAETHRPNHFLYRLRSFLRPRPAEHSVRETLEELIEEREEAEAPIDPGERELLRNVLTLRDLTVSDVMVARAHVYAVDVDTPFADALARMSEVAHSRLPVYRETLDDVIGMIHIKDVLTASLPRPAGAPAPTIEALIRPVLFVPPSMRTLDVLLEMRLKRTHLAMVVDEYGGIDGLVTIEDLVEQIVGEIEDEHDDAPPVMLERRADGTMMVDAGTPIEELEQVIGPVLTEAEFEDVDTVGGLVTTLAGRVPEVGEIITHGSGIEIEIVAADPRRVETVRLRHLPAPTKSNERDGGGR